MHPVFEQITELAPDEKSLAAARQSMSPHLWSESGLSETAIWGKCQGSTTYDVAIDLLHFGYRCNCPSRKRPCRHVLALLMRFASQAESFPVAVPPSKVQEWLDQRRQRAQQQAAPSPRPKAPGDEAGQKKRAARRKKRVEQGIVQLERWLGDLIRNGLAGVELHGPRFWEDQARRLVDAQAPGLASRIRQLGELPASGPDWPRRLLLKLGRLKLLLHAYGRLSELPEDLQSEIRQLCGWSISQSELDAHHDRVQDIWTVIGQREEEGDHLRVQRNWLLGLSSVRTGLVLQFAPGTTPFAESWLVGSVFEGSLQFYPGVTRQRARVLERSEVSQVPDELPGACSIEQILSRFADQLAVQPWLESSVDLLKSATLTVHRGSWYLRDESGEGLPLSGAPPWPVLAETGGHPANIVLEWNGESASILSVMHSGTFIRF